MSFTISRQRKITETKQYQRKKIQIYSRYMDPTIMGVALGGRHPRLRQSQSQEWSTDVRRGKFNEGEDIPLHLSYFYRVHLHKRHQQDQQPCLSLSSTHFDRN